jgi:prepilin-type N-terminal cleavage/methylation domain-containing protein
MFKSFFKEQNRSLRAGFTLIELMVTLSIFVIITAVVLFSQSQFNGSILLTNLAYDVGLTIRQAQSFGTSGKYSDSFQLVGGLIKPTYGVHLETGNNSKYMVLFADLNNDGKLTIDASAPGNKISDSDFCKKNSECLEKYVVRRNNKIFKICDSIINTGSQNCSYTSADISFVRPDPTAKISKVSVSGVSNTGVEIVVSTGDGLSTRSVIVETIGQIYVKR